MKFSNRDKRNLFMGIVAVTVLLVVTLFVIVNNSFGTQPEPYKVICHHNPSQGVTLSFQNVQSYNGHLGTPHNDEVYDTDGECEEPTPTETEEEPTPTETEPTPTKGEEPKLPGDGLSDNRSDGLSSCPSCTAPPPVVTLPPCTPSTCVDK